jgi:D-alanyl-D-alanine carboxypeptidase (penicillin-binding protein 5/6)
MLKAIAVSSANDAACAMAEHIAGSEEAFVQQMNARAAELGMEDTRFVNCTGLDDGPEAAEHLMSAHDIALMSRQLLLHHPEIKKFTTVWMDTLRGGTFGLSNTNKMVRFYSGATGLKTGFTAKAGYCLSASALREGMELVAVVMGSETSKDRFAACKSLLDYGFANYALIRPESRDGSVPVKLGEADAVNASPVREPCLLIDKSQKSTVTTQITLDREVTAPVSKGQRLGMLTIRSGEQVLDQIPLVAAAPVRKLTWGQVFAKVLRQLCMAKP